MAGERLRLRPSFTAAHQREWNLLAAAAAVRAIGVVPGGDLEVAFSAGRGERIELAGGLTLVDDCYNANPMSMRAALQDLAVTAPAGGASPCSVTCSSSAPTPPRSTPRSASARARRASSCSSPSDRSPRRWRPRFAGHTVTLADASEAAAELPALLRDGDTVLVKGSQGVGLARVVEAVRSDRHAAATGPRPPGAVVPSGPR